jgi:pilus assembly protein CpaE
MNERPIVSLIGASSATETFVKAALGEQADLRVEPNLAIGAASTRKIGARIVLIDVSRDPAQALQVMHELAAANGEAQVVALAAAKDPDLILRAMRAGAREFVVRDDAREVARVVAEAARRARSDQPSGAIISLFPAKGGSGATAIATGLAGMLLDGHKRVVIVDLDLQLGDVLVFLDMASRYTIADVLHNMKRLDRELLIASVARHSSGLYVLAQSDHIEEADKVSPALVGPLLLFLARHFDYVVCDGLRGFDEMSLAALDASNRILLLLSQDVPSIKNAQRCLAVFRRLSYDMERVSLLVNRYQKSDKIDLQAIGENLGLGVMGVVANDYPTMIKAINRGALLSDVAPRAKVTDDLKRVASNLAGVRPKERGGFLRGLFQRTGQTGKVEAIEETATKPDDENEPERAPEAV